MGTSGGHEGREAGPREQALSKGHGRGHRDVEPEVGQLRGVVSEANVMTLSSFCTPQPQPQVDGGCRSGVASFSALFLSWQRTQAQIRVAAGLARSSTRRHWWLLWQLL